MAGPTRPATLLWYGSPRLTSGVPKERREGPYAERFPDFDQRVDDHGCGGHSHPDADRFDG